MAQAHEFVARLPDGYETVIGERGITLSGGQRQRIAIARAILVDPRVLVLDDATASVDATTEAQIRLGLREAMKGRTTRIVAHRLDHLARGRDRQFDHGRVVAWGTARRPDRREPGRCGGLPARPPRARSRAGGGGGGRLVRVYQPGSHLTQQRGVAVDDWSWARTVRRVGVLVSLTKPYRARGRSSRSSRLAATAAAGALFLAKLAIDEGILEEDLGVPRLDDRGLLGAGILYWVASSVQTYLTGWVGERILADLRRGSSATCSGSRSASTSGTGREP